jgi:hypothetical protein
LKLTCQALMSLGLMIASAYAVITAMKWPMRTALFPITAGIPVFFMALAVFVQEQVGKRTEKGASGDSAVDFKLSPVENQALANKRTLNIVLWMMGFFVLILLIGFSLGVPIYFIAFLRFRCKESWRITIVLSAIAWGFFYGLFVRLLNTPFMDGWIQRGLGSMGILK